MRAIAAMGLILAGMALGGCGGNGVCAAQSCACDQGDACTFECPQGSCNQSCSGTSTCEVSCAGGSCNQACTEGAECTLGCEGGSCTQSCVGTTGTCSATCAGGSCVTDLAIPG